MKKCDILLKNGTLLTPELEIKEGISVAISGGRIAEVREEKVLDGQYDAKETIDASGKLIMPGLVDSHVHACQYMLRGKLADEYPMVWTRILVPFESTLNEQDSYLSGQLTYLQQIKSGITTCNESGGNHMHMVVKAAEESGIRANIARSTMDQGAFIPDSWRETAEEAIERTEELYKNCNNLGNGRIKIWFAMRQVMSCSPKLLRMIGEKASEYNTGIHAHLCEHRDEVSYCLQNYRKRPVEVLYDYGILGKNFLGAHNVVLTDADIELLAKCDAKLCHCPRANLGNHGVPRTPTILHAGLSIGIGSDGASGCNMDFFEELRILRFALQAVLGLPIFDPTIIPIKALLKMLIKGGARAALMEKEIGEISAGMRADVILLDIEQPHIMPNSNLINVLVEGVRASDVTDSIIDGRLIMRNREVLTMDEKKIIADGKQRMKEIFARAGI
ncbi:MAG: amidohydrolase [Bacillota bacterium]|nr:amidohydrolase [Bacillota bacterium]